MMPHIHPIHPVHPALVRRLCLATLAVLAWGATLACGGGSDDLLNEYGAAGAAQTEIDIVLTDFAIEGGETAGEAGGPTFRIGAHTDLVIHVRNTGAVPHGLTLYADEAATEVLVASPEIAPGETVDIHFHFHDPQVAYLRDDHYPDRMRARLVVEEHGSDQSAVVPVTVTYEDRADSPFHAIPYDPAPQAPPLALERADGSVYDLAEQRGRVTVVMFGYVNCIDICPLTVSTYAAAIRSLDPEDAERVDFVMVTVDPERESPREVQGYVDRFGDGLIGLGGTVEDVDAVLDAWRVRREIGSISEDIIPTGVAVGHTSYTVIVDGEGLVRLKVPAHTGMEDLAADLALIVQEG